MSSPKFTIVRAEEKDSDDLNSLMRDASQQSELWDVIVERQPNFFYGMGVVTSEPDVWLGRVEGTGQPAGCMSVGSRKVYVNGECQTLRYCSDMRVHTDFRGGELLEQLFMVGGSQAKEGEWAQTHIIAENKRSLRALASGRENQPMYYSFGDYAMNLIIYFGINKPPIESKYTIRRAQTPDLDAMQKFFNEEAPKRQFYPHYDFDKIGTDDPYYRDIKLEDYYLAFDKDELVGITGLWNQTGFKQSRFTNYKLNVRIMRPIYNIYAKLFNAFKFPADSEAIQTTMLHTVLTQNNNVDIFKVLLREIFRSCKHRKYKALALGLVPEDPLNEAVYEYRRMIYPGKHFAIAPYGDPRPSLDTSRIYYLEFSRL